MSPRMKELLARPGLERLNDWVNIGPVQKAALEEFTELVVLECARVVKASSPNGMIGVTAIRFHFWVQPTDAELERRTGEPHVDGWPLQSGLPPPAKEQL
jgi:hypothetical protein